MSLANIASLAVAKDLLRAKTGKLAIFAKDTLLESCSKIDFRQLFYSINSKYS